MCSLRDADMTALLIVPKSQNVFVLCPHALDEGLPNRRHAFFNLFISIYTNVTRMLVMLPGSLVKLDSVFEISFFSST